MPRCLWIKLCVALVLFAASDSASAESDQVSPDRLDMDARGRDAHGDPLPQFVTARLGTTRFKHTNDVRAIAGSPDGKWIASGADDNTVVIWEAETGKRLVTFKKHEDDVNHLVWSRDGKVIVSADEDKMIYFWEAKTGRLIAECTEHQNEINGIALDPKGKFLVSCSSDDTVRRWDLDFNRWMKPGADKAILKKSELLTDHDDELEGLAISPDGKWLAGYEDDTVFIWQTDKWHMTRRFKALSRVEHLVWMHQGGKLGINLKSKSSIQLLEPHMTRLKVETVSLGQRLRQFVFTPDDQSLIGVDQKYELIHMDFRSQKVIKRYEAGGSRISALSLFKQNHNDGKRRTRIVAGGRSGGLYFWNLNNRKRVLRYPGHDKRVFAAVHVPSESSSKSGERDQGSVITASEDGKIGVWRRVLTKDQASGPARGEWQQLAMWDMPKDVEPYCISLSPDYQWLAISGDDAVVRLWRANDFLKGDYDAFKALKGNKGTIYTLAWSLDQKYLAGGDTEGQVIVWQTDGFKRLRKMKDHDDRVFDIVWSPDGSKLYTADGDKMVREWQVSSGKVLRKFAGHEEDVFKLAISPDGYMLASGSEDDTIRLWELSAGRERRILEGSEGDVYTLHWLNNSRHLVSGGGDGKLRFWDVNSGCCIKAQEGHDVDIYDLVYDEAAQQLITTGEDTVCHVWDLANWKKQKLTKDVARELAKSQARKVNWQNDKSLAKMWQDLAKNKHAKETDRAYQHIRSLSELYPDAATEWLAEKMRLMRFSMDAAVLKQIALLNDRHAKVREKAFYELQDMGVVAHGVITQVLRDKTNRKMTLEAKLLLKKLHARSDVNVDGSTLRAYRVLEILDRIHQPASKKVLQLLAEKEGTHPAKLRAKLLLSKWDESYYANPPKE